MRTLLGLAPSPFLSRLFSLSVLALFGSWLSLATAAPPNDSILQPTTMSGPSGQIAGTTVDASVQSGEESVAAFVQGQSVWYRWPCFARGKVRIWLTDHTAGTRVAAFSTTRSSWGFPDISGIRTAVAGDNISFEVDPSYMYIIAVVSDTGARAPFVLHWEETVAANNGIDLAIVPQSVRAAVQTRDFNGLACELDEGCTKAGRRKLLSVDFDVLNVGTEDVLFGNPYNSPYSVFGYCEEWRRLIGFFQIRVYNAQQQLVSTADPLISCFAGTRKELPNAPDSRRFNCLKQGLRAGWLQKFNSYPPCQFADITDLAPGEYTAEVVVDPRGWLSELRKDNNAVKVPFVVLPSCSEAPSNDNRSDAIEVEGGVATLVGSNECAGREPNEGRHVITSPASRSVWFKWTAPTSGSVTWSTEGSSFDTVLDVQGPATNGVNGLVIASGDDIESFNQQSRVTFQAVAGNTYWIALDGFNRGDGAQSGPYVLSLNPGGNDAFGAAELLRGTGGAVSGSNLKATKEALEPAHAGNAGGKSVWYQWVASADGKLTLDAEGSKLSLLLSAYRGEDLGSVKVVADNRREGGGLGSTVTFDVKTGEKYRIAVDGENGASGMFKLAWKLEAKVPNEEPVGPKLAVALRKNKTVRLTVTGKKGTLMTVERSTDLVHWTSLARFKLNVETDTFSDMEAPQWPKAFYRVRVVQ